MGKGKAGPSAKVRHMKEFFSLRSIIRPSPHSGGKAGKKLGLLILGYEECSCMVIFNIFIFELKVTI